MKIERYRQIINELRHELSSGKYKTGDILPIRLKLAKRFKTTRSTVNRAIEVLINDGLLAARRGSGTVVQSLEVRLKIAYLAPEWLMRHMPRSKDCELLYFPLEEIDFSQKTSKFLSAFDGIIWSHPDVSALPQIAAVAKTIPSVLINREYREIDSICSNYNEIFTNEVSRLLAEHQNATPYFLSSKKPGIPQQQRHEAYINACRQHNRFYENIQMPPDYNSKLSELDKILSSKHDILLLFADDWSHTGAVISWAKQNKRQFGKDVFYIDFDNTEPSHVWGILTTSVIQDFDELTETAFRHLTACLKKKQKPAKLHINPSLRQGSTA